LGVASQKAFPIINPNPNKCFAVWWLKKKQALGTAKPPHLLFLEHNQF
jgi:hypothetical protein